MSLFLLASDLGFDDEALDLLERGVETRDARMIQLNRVRESSRFKDHPRFKAVVAKMGFP